MSKRRKVIMLGLKFLGVLVITLGFIIGATDNLSNAKDYLVGIPIENIGMDLDEVMYDEVILSESEVSNLYLVDMAVVDDTIELLDLGELDISGFMSFIHYRYEKEERYEAYSQLYPDLDPAVVVTYVNIGLDRPFYSHVEDVEDKSSYLVLVNKYNTLSSDFEPSDFAGVSRSLTLRKEVQEIFDIMQKDARSEGINLSIVSGYRSYDTQRGLYENYKARNAETVDTFSARPGHSEHQTGLAVDINTTSSSVKFENSKEYAWLLDHAHEYGFILRYPLGKEHITGYMFEPWHWRYVGEYVASVIQETGLTLDEYVERLPRVNGCYQ